MLLLLLGLSRVVVWSATPILVLYYLIMLPIDKIDAVCREYLDSDEFSIKEDGGYFYVDLSLHSQDNLEKEMIITDLANGLSDNFWVMNLA